MTTLDRSTAEGILYTDQYQLTMAQLYFRQGLHEQKVQFDHFFRSYPDYGRHQAGYCVNAGMGWLLDWMGSARFRKQDVDHLRGQTGREGQRLFHDDFLEWLVKNGSFDTLSIKAIPEGRVVHPHVPLTVVQGPLIMAQILETPLLNMLNYQTLIATKAARVHEAARGQMVIEFGMRRAHDRGANAGARAAMIGGAEFTSNSGISYALGYPPKGTHAHSMVQLFMALGEGELGAFRAYADVYPDDCLLLVDTVNTLESGLPNAIRVFEDLKRRGHKPFGIRLDSGDLAYLSIQAARMLDRAGFPDTVIVLSNQLDELVIWQIMTQIDEEAALYGLEPDRLRKRLVFGVGTRLITSAGDPALDGVYKLVSVHEGGTWRPAIKFSETIDKVINPGTKQVWRLYDQRGKSVADLVATAGERPAEEYTIMLRHPLDSTKSRRLERKSLREIEPLLADVLKDGRHAASPPGIEEMRKRRREDTERLDSGVKRLVNPHAYHVSLSAGLWDLKQEMIESIKGEETAGSA